MTTSPAPRDTTRRMRTDRKAVMALREQEAHFHHMDEKRRRPPPSLRKLRREGTKR